MLVCFYANAKLTKQTELLFTVFEFKSMRCSAVESQNVMCTFFERRMRERRKAFVQSMFTSKTMEKQNAKMCYIMNSPGEA